MEQAPFELKIRRLTEEDIPFAMELKNIAGWNQVEADWLGYLELEPEGCFLAEVNGRKAGTATAIRYGTKAGWIGMVLVHPDLRRYGIGKALLNRTIGYLKGMEVECIKLDATPMGKTVYVPLGFVDEYELKRYQGPAVQRSEGTRDVEQADQQADSRADQLNGQQADQRAGKKTGQRAGVSTLFTDTDMLQAVEVIPAADDLLEELINYDASYFGIRREEVLRKLASRDRQYGFCVKEHNRITGYLLAHQGRHAVQAGPWVASRPQTAEALFKALLSAADGQQIFLDVPDRNAAGAALMAKYGFTVQRGFSRMYLGRNAYPGLPEGIYGTSGAEKG